MAEGLRNLHATWFVLSICCMLHSGESLAIEISPSVAYPATGSQATFTCTYYPQPSDEPITEILVRWYSSDHQIWEASNTKPTQSPVNEEKQASQFELSGSAPEFDDFYRTHELTFSQLRAQDSALVRCWVSVTRRDNTKSAGYSKFAKLSVDGAVNDTAIQHDPLDRIDTSYSWNRLKLLYFLPGVAFVGLVVLGTVLGVRRRKKEQLLSKQQQGSDDLSLATENTSQTNIVSNEK